MQNFITEIEIADENGEVTVAEVVTTLTPEQWEVAEKLTHEHGGYMSHDEIVASVRRA